jgi:hypothetical protein
MKYPECRGAPAPDIPDAGSNAPSQEGRREDSGWLDTPQGVLPSTIFFESRKGNADFMKYPECRGAPAPDIPDADAGQAAR